MNGRRSNREILTGGKKYIQRQNKKHGVDEVTFDKGSREEYLTGFHKRKLQRQKKAQEFHKEQERLARIEERKRLRDERKRDLQTQLQKFNESVKDVTNYDNSDDEYDKEKGRFQLEQDDQSEEESEEKEDGEDDIEEASEWNGIDDEEGHQNANKLPKGILHHKEVYKIEDPTQFEDTDAVIDDDTTVTVESVDNPIMSNIQQLNLEARAKANNVNLDKSEEILNKSIKRAQNYAVTAGVSKPNSSTKDRIKKKKFRYLSKAERRENNRKQKQQKAKRFAK